MALVEQSISAVVFLGNKTYTDPIRSAGGPWSDPILGPAYRLAFDNPARRAVILADLERRLPAWRMPDEEQLLFLLKGALDDGTPPEGVRLHDAVVQVIADLDPPVNLAELETPFTDPRLMAVIEYVLNGVAYGAPHIGSNPTLVASLVNMFSGMIREANALRASGRASDWSRWPNAQTPLIHLLPFALPLPAAKLAEVSKRLKSWGIPVPKNADAAWWARAAAAVGL